MADEKVYSERWSGITPDDLGLQAAYWTGNETDPVIFRPIVGWVTYTVDDPNPTDNRPRNGLAPLVLADFWLPVLAKVIADYQAVVPKGIAAADALVRIKEWRAQPEQAQAQVNVRDVGKA